MNAQTAFSIAIENNFHFPCPATQDAIDRLVEAEGFRGRSGIIEVLRSRTYTDLDFNSALMNWKDADIKHASGHSREKWLSLCENMKTA